MSVTGLVTFYTIGQLLGENLRALVIDSLSSEVNVGSALLSRAGVTLKFNKRGAEMSLGGGTAVPLIQSLTAGDESQLQQEQQQQPAVAEDTATMEAEATRARTDSTHYNSGPLRSSFLKPVVVESNVVNPNCTRVNSKLLRKNIRMRLSAIDRTPVAVKINHITKYFANERAKLGQSKTYRCLKQYSIPICSPTVQEGGVLEMGGSLQLQLGGDTVVGPHCISIVQARLPLDDVMVTEKLLLSERTLAPGVAVLPGVYEVKSGQISICVLNESDNNVLIKKTANIEGTALIKQKYSIEEMRAVLRNEAENSGVFGSVAEVKTQPRQRKRVRFKRYWRNYASKNHHYCRNILSSLVN